MVVYTLEQRRAILRQIDLQRMPILAKKKKNIFSDEAHFDHSEYVNKQNCRICCTENLHAYIEKPTHPKRVTVWCGSWSRGIIDHFSSKMSKESIAILIGPRWTNFCSQKLKRRILTTFLQDISIGRHYVPHSRSYTRWFAPCFWRSPYQPQSWCRLATSELRFDTVELYYLWGAVKDKSYADNPEPIDALKDNIREPIGEIQLHIIDNVLKNWTDAWPDR